MTGGKALVTVHVLGFPLTETRDVCNERGVVCPLQKGKTTTTIIQDHIPGLTPGFSITAIVRISDQAGAELTCIQAHVDVKSTPLIGGGLGGQIKNAMEQYIRMRPTDPWLVHPLLRGTEGGGGKKRKV